MPKLMKLKTIRELINRLSISAAAEVNFRH